MTEAEWLACDDPHPMIFFAGPPRSERRLRLLACAAARRVNHLLEDGRFRVALDTGERYADGRASLDEGRAVYREAVSLVDPRPGERGPGPLNARDFAAGGATYACWVVSTAEWEEMDGWRRRPQIPGVVVPNKTYIDDLLEITASVLHVAALSIAGLQLAAGVRVDHPDPGEQRRQCQLVRCIFGNPFRPLPWLNPAWLAWEGGIVAKLAGAMYDERAFDRLPILADALEEAGCTEVALFTHLRGPGPHVRGCWALDLLLGKS